MMPPLRVVIIEDNPDDKDITEHLLRSVPSEALSVSWESTLADGMARIEESLPDVVLLDLGLPDTNSAEDTLRTYRGRFPELPTVAVSSMADSLPVMRLSNELYIDAVWSKYDLAADQLMESVRRAIAGAVGRGAIADTLAIEINEKLDKILAFTQ